MLTLELPQPSQPSLPWLGQSPPQGSALSHVRPLHCRLGLAMATSGKVHRVILGRGAVTSDDASRHLRSGLGWESWLGSSPVPAVKDLQIWASVQTQCRYEDVWCLCPLRVRSCSCPSGPRGGHSLQAASHHSDS